MENNSFIKNIIRRTKSICPVCLISLDALVVEKNEGIFLVKTCVQHGSFEILLSRCPLYYKNLDEFYFTIMDADKKPREYEFWPTLKCNMECRICCFRGSREFLEESEPNCKEIADFIKNCKTFFYTISGGEPTCRNDLSEIIGILTKHGKTVAVNTNGLKLIDIKYLNKLKESGLKRVNFQFDGFKRRPYQILRGTDVLDIKLKALENLKILDIPTVLNTTIAKNVNEDTVMELINYAAKNNFINAVTFFTICSIGGARNWPLENYIIPDEIIDIVEEKTQHKVTRKNVFLFQKLHLAIKSFFSQRFCFYNSVYLFIRNKETYEPIEKFLNLDKSEFWLDKYRCLYNRSRFLSGLFLFMALVTSLLTLRSYKIIRELIIITFSYFFKTARYLKTKKFFYISFSTGCDPYKIDYAIVKNCQNEIIAMNTESGKLGYEGRGCLYCINLEKKHLSEENKFL